MRLVVPLLAWFLRAVFTSRRSLGGAIPPGYSTHLLRREARSSRLS
jgi:hypothetical protein